jgi:hypothetical protein
MEGRRDTAFRDAVVLALVVTGLGVGATLPRGSHAYVAERTVSRLPASPCTGLAAAQREACLHAAGALLSR